jgi:hypothetical protein
MTNGGRHGEVQYTFIYSLPALSQFCESLDFEFGALVAVVVVVDTT